MLPEESDRLPEESDELSDESDGLVEIEQPSGREGGEGNEAAEQQEARANAGVHAEIVRAEAPRCQARSGLTRGRQAAYSPITTGQGRITRERDAQRAREPVLSPHLRPRHRRDPRHGGVEDPAAVHRRHSLVDPGRLLALPGESPAARRARRAPGGGGGPAHARLHRALAGAGPRRLGHLRQSGDGAIQATPGDRRTL